MHTLNPVDAINERRQYRFSKADFPRTYQRNREYKSGNLKISLPDFFIYFITDNWPTTLFQHYRLRTKLSLTYTSSTSHQVLNRYMLI